MSNPKRMCDMRKEILRISDKSFLINPSHAAKLISVETTTAAMKNKSTCFN